MFSLMILERRVGRDLARGPGFLLLALPCRENLYMFVPCTHDFEEDELHCVMTLSTVSLHMKSMCVMSVGMSDNEAGWLKSMLLVRRRHGFVRWRARLRFDWPGGRPCSLASHLTFTPTHDHPLPLVLGSLRAL